MPVVEIICLAKSRKLGGSCLAGLRTDGQGWIRPVSSASDGVLFPRHYTLNNGEEADVGNILRIDLDSPLPQLHQPENWLIGNQTWQLVDDSVFPKIRLLLQSYVVRGPLLLGNLSDRIAFDSFIESPARSSLALVIPENLQWEITTSLSGRRQTRAIFTLSGMIYDLAVTDPVLEYYLRQLPSGIHPFNGSRGFDPDCEIWLTISLGEPFNGYCYKLVAAVLLVPRS